LSHKYAFGFVFITCHIQTFPLTHTCSIMGNDHFMTILSHLLLWLCNFSFAYSFQSLQHIWSTTSQKIENKIKLLNLPRYYIWCYVKPYATIMNMLQNI
jgi:hypothetical protein